MRLTGTLVMWALAGFQLAAQSFSGTGGTISNNGIPTNFQLQVSGLPSSLGSGFGLEEVCVQITHPGMEEISVSLKSPSGVVVELINSTGIKGNNFSSTCFNSKAGTSITMGTAPYTGSFKPTGFIGRFNNSSSGNGQWQLMVKDYNPNTNSGTLDSWSLTFGNSAPQAVSVSSSNLPLIFINTNSQAITSNSIMVDFGMVDNSPARNNVSDFRNTYNGKARIHVRGSSSMIFEKKSLKVDLCDANGAPIDATLGHMPGESDWVLTPAYNDKTLMRNALTHHMFRQMGHYSPRTVFVEVFIDNEYYGVYTLVEKPKRHPERVNLFKMGPDANQYPYVTGGYLFQINRSDNEPNEGWWSEYPGNTTAGTKFFYQYEYPRGAEITLDQKKYLEAYMDTFETVMEGPNFADPVNGYRRYIDVRSFADFFIMNEFSKNVDAYKLSTFMYKDNVFDGGKLHAGPMWDYDIAWHNATNAIYGPNAETETWWLYDIQVVDNPIPKWWIKLLSDTYFKDMVWCRWNTMRKGDFQTNNINAYIDQQVAILSESQARNFTQFPILDAYIFPNPPAQIGPNYQGMVDDMKTYIAKRAAWLDQNIFGFCNDVSVQDNTKNDFYLAVYPNPASGRVSMTYALTRGGMVSTEVLDITGRQVKNIPPTRLDIGEHTQMLDISDLPAGSYLIKLSVDGKNIHRKIIKSTI